MNNITCFSPQGDEKQIEIKKKAQPGNLVKNVSKHGQLALSSFNAEALSPLCLLRAQCHEL